MSKTVMAIFLIALIMGSINLLSTATAREVNLSTCEGGCDGNCNEEYTNGCELTCENTCSGSCGGNCGIKTCGCA